MKRKDRLLLRTLLRSTSLRNIYKYTKDKKKKSRIVGNFIGMFILYLLLMAYLIAMCIGYGIIGLTEAIPVMCALTISLLSFVFTLFKTNGYLFAFKEYDMLMSLPFEVNTIVKSKFLYMYVKSLPWYVSISVSMLVGYAIYVKPVWAVYPVWIILSLILPIIPMLFAAFIGFVIAKIGSGFKKTKIVQTVLTFAFVLLAFCSRFIIEGIFKDGKVNQTLESISEMTNKAGSIYIPVKWFSDAVTNLRISDMFLLIGITIVLFEVVFILVSKSYRKINSALKSNVVHKDFKMTKQKKNSVLNAIAFKEYKRLTGSTVYMTNALIGEIIVAIFGIVSLFLGIDSIIATVTEGAPITTKMLLPTIPLIIYFFIGMVPNTACSPSLEGKNYWIVKSMPIESKTLFLGKILFNLYLTIPFTVFSTICICISAKAGVLNTILYLIQGVLLCGFSSCFGCACGMKHMRLDWENEIEVVKQGSAVAVYLFPNMFGTMILVVGVAFLSMSINPILVTLLLSAVIAILTLLCYRRVLSLAKRM